jgi:hypothetical protein
MTAVGILIWEAYAKLIHRRKLRADGKVSGSRPRLGLIRWARYPRISFAAWSGSIRYGFDDFNDMWTWAEIEREKGRTRQTKNKELRAELKTLRQQLADLTKPKPDPEPVVEAEVIDPEPAPEINPGPTPERKELEAGPSGPG